MKLKNTLRHIMGADLITHLGWNITMSTCGGQTLPLVATANAKTKAKAPSVEGGAFCCSHSSQF